VEAPEADPHPARPEAADRQRLPEPAKIIDAAQPAVRDIKGDGEVRIEITPLSSPSKARRSRSSLQITLSSRDYAK
jgi:hypothetical protein